MSYVPYKEIGWIQNWKGVVLCVIALWNVWSDFTNKFWKKKKKKKKSVLPLSITNLTWFDRFINKNHLIVIYFDTRLNYACWHMLLWKILWVCVNVFNYLLLFVCMWVYVCEEAYIHVYMYES